MASSAASLGTVAAAAPYDPMLAAEAGNRSGITVDVATGGSSSSSGGGGSHKRDRPEGDFGGQGQHGEAKRPKEEAKAGTPTPPGGGADEVESLRRENEKLRVGLAKLQGVMKTTLAAMEATRANLASEKKARTELAGALAEEQQLLGVAGHEAVVPAIRALKEAPAGQGNGAAAAAARLKAERDAAVKEAKEARAALGSAMERETQAKKRASAAEKEKQGLETKIKEQKRAVDGAEAIKMAAVLEVEKKLQASKSEVVALQAQLQQAQAASTNATRRADEADAARRQAKDDLDRYKQISEAHMTQRNQYKQRMEEAEGQLAAATQRAQAAEVTAQRAREEAERARAQARQQEQQGAATRQRYVERELVALQEDVARQRQELEAYKKKEEADAREKRRLDDGWAQETNKLNRVRGERDAAEREVEAAKARVEEERVKRRAADEARQGVQVELDAFKENYQQILAWIGSLCAAAGVPEGDDQMDNLTVWVEQQAARQREAAAAVAAAAAAPPGPAPGLTSPVSVKAGKAPRGGAGAAEEEEEEEEDDVGYSALAAKFAEAQQQLNKAKKVLFDLHDRRPEAVPARYYGQVSEEEIQEALLAENTVFSNVKKGVEKLMVRIDGDLRDARWRPFVRREGRIVKVDEEAQMPDKKDHKLPQYWKEFGQALVDLILAKRRELEEHNSSGLYPFKLLTGPDGELLPLDVALGMVIAKLEGGQDAAAAQQGGGGGGGGAAQPTSSGSSSGSSSSRRRTSQGRR